MQPSRTVRFASSSNPSTRRCGRRWRRSAAKAIRSDTIAVLIVSSPGLCTLIVDHGRPRWRSLGVPVGGAADRFALAIGNALVDNSPDAAALEISLHGPTLTTDDDVACVLYGAPFEMT